jgi:hypothetical protein
MSNDKGANNSALQYKSLFRGSIQDDLGRTHAALSNSITCVLMAIEHRAGPDLKSQIRSLESATSGRHQKLFTSQGLLSNFSIVVGSMAT